MYKVIPKLIFIPIYTKSRYRLVSLEYGYKDNEMIVNKWCSMRSIILFFIFLLPFSAQSKEKEGLTLAVYLPQSPPYTFIEPLTGEFTGIVSDILKGFAEQHNLNFKYKYLNRIRAEKSLYSGSTDVSLLSAEWVQFPDKLIYSKPLYTNGDKFYSIKEIKNSPSNLSALEGKTICTREYFRYRLFDQYVKKRLVNRMDTSSEINQFRMLLSNRCDFAYMNEWVANYILKSEFPNTKLYSSDETYDTSHGILAFTPKWQPYMARFNAYTKELKRSGKLAEIVERYTK